MEQSEAKRPVEELTIREFLASLKPSQVWKLLGIAVTLLGGAFALGYKLHDMVQGVQVKTALVSEMKNEFFARYNRYVTSRDAALLQFTVCGQIFEDLEDSIEAREKEGEIGEEQRNYVLARNQFVELISQWWGKQLKFEGDFVFQPEVIRKRFDPTNSRIVFADGSEYVVPPEIKLLVLQKEGQP